MFLISSGRIVLLFTLVLPTTFLLAGFDGKSSFLAAAEDSVEDIVDGEGDEEEEAEATVDAEGGDDDGGLPNEGAAGSEATEGETTSEESSDDEATKLQPSSDAETVVHFTKPQSRSEFPAGSPVRFLIGFSNKGSKNFIVKSIDASFRYPQDYSFVIQNFTTVHLNKEVEPKLQATFEYGFVPSETFNARPFGLTVSLNYKDADGNLFVDAVFNETVQITEPDEGLDGETFFLYVLLAALAVLLLVGAQQLVATYGKKRSSKAKQPLEMGTQNNADIDYDWIPKSSLEMNSKSPKRSPKQSPRQRRAKRSSGVDE